jgi:hypothetical protein
MKKDVSIILPSIRPENLKKFYDATCLACKEHTFEIVIVSPKNLPKELCNKENIKYLKSYASPTIAAQMGTLLCNADYLYNTTDDGLIEEDAIDEAIKLIKILENDSIINMVYEEGVLDPKTLEPLDKHSSHHPPQYWMAHYHAPLRRPGVQPGWKMCMHFLMPLELFYKQGGYDCEFQTINNCIHDLMFRCQASGSVIENLPRTAYKCSHLPEKTGDHGPVHDAQTGPDTNHFDEIYSHPLAAFKRKIEYDNWKNYPNVWNERFKDVK